MKPAPDSSERQTLQAIAHGDAVALARLYRQHHARLVRFLRRCTGRQELIDEVINDTMWVVWRKATDFRGDSRVSTWITGIAYRTMLQALRARAPGDEVGESMLPPLEWERALAAHSSAGPDDEAELRNWLAQGLRGLPDDQRMTLELAYGQGHTCEEIAQIMDCAVGTVKARMFHARVRLRSVLPALGEPRQRGQG
jgi:RNA polymerase sigma-70 factor, ECF subfamily